MAVAFALYTASVAIVFWPGQMDPDTIDELQSAATGQFNNWHTPLLSALWRGPYLLGLRSPGWVLAISVFSMLVGFYLLLRVRFRRAASAVIAIACFTWPPVLSWGVHDGRDTWFIALLMCAFGFTARLMRMGPNQSRLNLVASLICAYLCAATWEIALAPLLALFFLTAFIVLPARTRHRVFTAGAVGLVGCITIYGTQAGLEAAIHTTQEHPQQVVYEYDLAQMSRLEGRVLFPRQVLVPHRKALAYFKTIPVGTFDGIVFGPQAVVQDQVGSNEGALQHAWLDAVLHNPIGYLEERTDLVLAELAITQPSFWTWQPSPDTPQFRPLSVSLRSDGEDFLEKFAVGGNLYGDVLYTVWVYVVILGVSIPVLLRRSRSSPPALVVAAFAIGLFMLGVVLFFASPILIYRIAYPFVVGGTVVAPLLLPSRRADIGPPVAARRHPAPAFGRRRRWRM